MLTKNEFGGETIKKPNGKVITLPEYQEFTMEYLLRIIDEGKYQRRENQRKKREDAKNKELENMTKKGYISIKEMMDASKLSYSTLYNAIKDGKMVGKNVCKTWFVQREDFDAYLRKYNPQPRPKKNNSERVLTPEEKLLRDVFKD